MFEPPAVKGAVRKVVELYKAGVPPREISLRVYGDDAPRFRQRVFSIIYLYGKRLGLLDTDRQLDTHRGEVVDIETGTVVEGEVRNGFIQHSSPVHPQDPFLGSYQTMQQLRASLNSSDRRVVDVLSHIDKLFGLLDDIPRESVIRQDACLLGTKNAHIDVWVSKIAVTSVIMSLLYHAPKRVEELVSQVEDLYERVKPLKAVRDCFEKGFTVPPQMMGVIMVNALRSMTAI